MGRRGTGVRWVAALAGVTALLLAGCTTTKEPPGPFRISLDKLEVHDRRNVTLHVTARNTGDQPITNPDVNLGGLIHDPTTGQTNYSATGRIQSGGAGLAGASPKLFNMEDTLSPGNVRELRLVISYSPQEWSSPTPEALYIFEVIAHYTAGAQTYSWTHDPPCFDSRGEPVVIRKVCDGSYVVFEPR